VKNKLKVERIKLEVFITDDLENICLVPLNGYQRQDIRLVIKDILGDIQMRSLAEGILIPSQLAHLLLRVENDLDMKWRGESKKFVENRARTLANIQNIGQQVEEITFSGVEGAEDLLKDLSDKDNLDDHQKINVAAMTLSELPGLCLFDEQGTGKTVTIIYTFDLLVHRDEVDIALVIAPKSMVPEWPVDLSRFRG